eukprot:c12491_g1_i1 orf=3-200(-)
MINKNACKLRQCQQPLQVYRVYQFRDFAKPVKVNTMMNISSIHVYKLLEKIHQDEFKSTPKDITKR